MRGQSAMQVASGQQPVRLAKGQSAMEFLMTYGWAILILVVVIIVLFYMGIMSPKQPNTCVFPPGISCYSFSVANGSGALTLGLGQALGRSVIVTGISCSANTTAVPQGLGNNITIPAGDRRWVVGGDSYNSLNCTDANGMALSAGAAEIGSRYKGRICIEYMEMDTSVSRTLCGDVGANLGEAQAAASATPTPNYPTCAPGGVIQSCNCTLDATGSYRLNQNLNSDITCITITAPGVTLDCGGKTITGEGITSGHGIDLSISTSGVAVRDCVVSNFNAGIYLQSLGSNTLTGNTVDANFYGIWLSGGTHSVISGNTVSNNDYGIRLSGSGSNNVTGNNILSGDYGIYLQNADDNNITGNTASGASTVVHLQYADGNRVSNNIITGNGTAVGVHLEQSDGNNLTYNTVSQRGIGLQIEFGSDGNLLANNTLTSGGYGISVTGSSGNTIANNTACGNSWGDIICYYAQVDGGLNTCGPPSPQCLDSVVCAGC